MSWIIYAILCMFLYGIMQFFIKLSSVNNPIVSSMYFVSAQFIAQIILGVFISKSNVSMSSIGIKYSIIGGIIAAIATILFFIAIQNAPISKVIPIVNLNVLVAVIIGITLLNEEVSLKTGLGIVFSLISIYLLTSN